MPEQYRLHSPSYEACVSSSLYIGLPKHSANPKKSPYFLPPLYLQAKLHAVITAAMTASSSAAIFVTQCLLVPGRRISTGVFLCRQSELFLSFRTKHSYSRIVDKKTRPKSLISMFRKLARLNDVNTVKNSLDPTQFFSFPRIW